MIGARIGARIGAVIGAAIGTDPLGSATWTKDAASGIGVPATLAEWKNAMTAAGLSGKNPFLLTLCQESSGNISDTIGGLTITAAGTGLAYQQAVSGWTRKAITFTDAGTGAFTTTDTSLPDISTTSMLVLTYQQLLAAPGATRSAIGMGTTVCESEYITTPRNRVVCGANNLNGGVDPTGAVRCNFLLIDRTAARCVEYTSQEINAPTFGATATGKRLRYGASGGSSPPMALLYGVAWQGANAELTNGQIKTLGQTLGWTMP